MSLKRFVERPEVRARLKLFRPNLARDIPVERKVQPKSDRYSLVGTAFDYLLRFELQRRAPHAQSRGWVAARASLAMWMAHPDRGAAYLPLSKGHTGAIAIVGCPTATTMQRVAEDARNAVNRYVRSKSPTQIQKRAIASHAIRLGKLDAVFRSAGARGLDARFEHADDEDVQELLEILGIVPFASLLHDEVLMLNPVFPNVSRLVGGADADLIAGDMLVDFKTTQRDKVQADDLDQLFAYFLLARREHQLDGKFPEIKRLALYFCRHGYLWTLDADTWTSHAEFVEVERWFFEHAATVFPLRHEAAPAETLG